MSLMRDANIYKMFLKIEQYKQALLAEVNEKYPKQTQSQVDAKNCVVVLDHIKKTQDCEMFASFEKFLKSRGEFVKSKTQFVMRTRNMTTGKVGKFLFVLDMPKEVSEKIQQLADNLISCECESKNEQSDCKEDGMQQ